MLLPVVQTLTVAIVMSAGAYLGATLDDDVDAWDMPPSALTGLMIAFFPGVLLGLVVSSAMIERTRRRSGRRWLTEVGEAVFGISGFITPLPAVVVSMLICSPVL